MKIFKDSFIYLIGELVAKMLPFLLLPYLSRKLGVEGFGELSYYQTVLALLGIFLALGQDGAVSRYFYFYGKRSLNLVVISGYAYTLIIGSIMLVICGYFKSEIMAYLVITSVFQTLLTVQLVIRQCQKQALNYTIIQLLSGVVSTLLTIIMLEIFTEELIEKRFIALLLSNIIVFILSYLLYSKKLEKHKKFDLKRYKLGLLYIMSFGAPLLMHHISWFLRGQLDRIFIYHRFNEVDLGLYSMGATIASILSVVIMAINKAVVPYYYESLKKQTLTLVKIHRWAFFSLLLVPLSVIIVLIIPESLFLWLLGEQFVGVKYYTILFLISVSLVIPYFILVNYLFYYGKKSWISLCSILTTIVYTTLLSILMFSQIEFVPYASILSAIVILPILYIMTKKAKLA